MRKNLLLTIFAFCCFSIGFSQADCANALTLTPGVAQAGDSTGQTGDFPNAGGAPENPCNANYNDDEYWFEYTATANGEVLELTVTDITQNWAGVFVIDDCPSGTPSCVAQDTNTTNGTEDLTVTTPGLTAGVSYKIVISNWGTPDNTAFTMNSVVVPPPACPNPSALDAMNITTNSAELSWTAGDTESLWNIELVDVTAGGTQTMTATATGVSNPYDLMGSLVPANDYEYYVQADCTGGELSEWVGPFAFTTLELCPTPSDLDATNITETSAELSWTENGSASAWDIEIVDVTAGGTQTMTATATGVSNPYDAMGLTPSNDYEYYVQVDCGLDGTSNWAGPYSFTTVTPPPANDDFANAIAIDCSSGTVMGSTSAATLDEDDAPDGGGADLDAPNVWYSLDSSVDGASDVTLDLCGSGYDTSVLVYTGTSGNLTFVAGNDDNAAVCGPGFRSYLTFPTDGTSTYYITVEGYDPGSIGDFEVVVSCITATPAPDNDDCGDAIALTTGISASGTTVGATTSPGDAPTCDTFGSIADVWYSFEITGGESDLSISTTITGTSDEANVALYDDCAALAANSLGCTDDNGNETLDVTNLAIGTYYIRVWSDGNAPPTAGRVEGTFDIVVNATLSTSDLDNSAAFTYYPNPVKNTLTLNAQNSIEDVTMYNMLGQIVLRNNPNAINSDIDMSNLQAGAYFVEVTIANVTKTIRVIKQ